jgi:hypothetical protein
MSRGARAGNAAQCQRPRAKVTSQQTGVLRHAAVTGANKVLPLGLPQEISPLHKRQVLPASF